MRTIPLPRGYEAIVDDEDYDALMAYCWRASPDVPGAYAVRTDHSGPRYITVRMHRQIMGVGVGTRLIVDHINGNTLDNRRSNLRIATQQQNQINRIRLASNNSTGFTGVNRVKSGRWAARIINDGQAIHLGTFDTIEEAVAARQAAEVRVYGAFAPRRTA